MLDSASLIWVTGATGAQGGAVARALLARKHPVRALVRNPDSPAAHGDMDDARSLLAAMRGVDGVF